MTKYNKVYFLHIPKTGGRFLKRYILDQVEETLKSNGIQLITDPLNLFNNHSGWHKDIDDETYVISIFRDPIEFFVSAICHVIYQDNKMTDEFNDSVVIKEHPVLDIPKEKLYESIEKFPFLENFQSKNFILTPKYGLSTVDEARIELMLEKPFDDALAYERIKRVNLMIRQKDLSLMDYSKLIFKLSEDLGVELKINLPIVDKEKYKNDASTLLFNKLNKEDITAFYKSFLFDKKIYEDDSLFWNAQF